VAAHIDSASASVFATPHPYRWAILASLWFMYFCFGMTAASLAPLVEPITRALGISHSAMGTVLGAWALVYIASSVPCGALMDRLGPRRSLLLAMTLIALSGALRGFAEGHLSLFLAVALFGLGGPLVSIGAPKLVALWFSGPERGLAMGVYVTGPNMGTIIALSLSNSVLMPLTGGDWRQVMFFYAAVAVVGGLVWLAVSSHASAREVERNIAAQPRGGQWRIFADLLRLRPVQLVLTMSVCIFFFNHGLNAWLPELLRVGGMDVVRAGYWASIPTAVGLAGALLIPRLATPSRRLAILTALFCLAGISSILLQAGSGPLLASGLICQGIARSSMMAVAMLILMEIREVGARHTGSASGLFFTAAEVGGVLGPVTLGVLYDYSGDFTLPLFTLTGMCVALLVLVNRLRRVM